MCSDCIRLENQPECEESPTGKHEIHPASVTAQVTNLTIDFSCKHCGVLGSIYLDPKVANWE